MSLIFIQGTLVVFYGPKQKGMTSKQLEQYLISKPQFAIGSMLLWYAAIFFFLYVTLSLLRGQPFWRSLGWRKIKPSAQPAPDSPIRFTYQPIDFKLDSSETPERHAPETMAGGVAVFDFNNDGKLDIFFTNGADIKTLRKDSPKYYNRLFENDGHGYFSDVTEKSRPRRNGLRRRRCHRRLRQRRLRRHFRSRRLSQHALPQQRRRNLHRRHRQSRP